MDREAVWDATVTQRLATAAMLRELAPADWERPSLCDRWRIRDVAAHLISGPQMQWLATARVLADAWRGFDEMIYRDGVRRGAAPIESIMEQFDRFAEVRRGPLVVGHIEPLIDAFAHGQDIARPLGIVHHLPAAPAAVAADKAIEVKMPGSRLEGLHLTAVDIDWTAGTGAAVEGPMEELFILATGRAARWEQLSGDGVAALRSRFSA